MAAEPDAASGISDADSRARHASTEQPASEADKEPVPFRSMFLFQPDNPYVTVNCSLPWLNSDLVLLHLACFSVDLKLRAGCNSVAKLLLL